VTFLSLIEPAHKTSKDDSRRSDNKRGMIEIEKDKEKLSTF
jgi:hypothetical protein